MFSGFELSVIMKWAKTGKDILISHLNSPLFTHEEKEDKRREYDDLNSIVETVENIHKEYICVDPDHLMELLGLCHGYYKHVQHKCEEGLCGATDSMQLTYQIGYMQGRLELGYITESDLNVLKEWETEVNK